MNDQNWKTDMDSCLSVVFWKTDDQKMWLFEAFYGVDRAQVFWHAARQLAPGMVWLTHTGHRPNVSLPVEIQDKIANGLLGNSGMVEREEAENKPGKTANMCVRDGCTSLAFFCTRHVVEKLCERLGK